MILIYTASLFIYPFLAVFKIWNLYPDLEYLKITGTAFVLHLSFSLIIQFLAGIIKDDTEIHSRQPTLWFNEFTI